jgi:hypothetical protein
VFLVPLSHFVIITIAIIIIINNINISSLISEQPGTAEGGRLSNKFRALR